MQPEPIIFEEKYPHEKGFSSYFDNEIGWRLQDMERDRLIALKYYRWANVVSYAAMAVIVWYLLKGQEMDPKLLPQGFIFGLILAAMAAAPGAWIKKRFEKTHKSHLMPAIAGFFRDTHYDQNDCLRPEEIKGFMICPTFNRHEGSDLLDVTGKFVSSRLLLKQRSSGKKKRTRVTFRGVGVLITLPEPVTEPVALKMDKGAVINWLEGALTRHERINLVDPVFERIFEVYGRNQVQARMILTTDVMELFLRLNFLFSNWKSDIGELEQMTRAVLANHNIEEVRDNMKASLMANYMGDRLLLLLKTPEDMFEPVSLKTTCLDMAQIRSVLYQVDLLNKLYDVLVKR